MKPVAYLGLAMSAFFIFTAVYIAVKQIFAPPSSVNYFVSHPDHFNYLIASLLGAYGIFRFVRSYKIVRNNEQ